MPVIDLTRYIVEATGTWTNPGQDENLFDFTLADTMSPRRLLLRWAGDFVALTGPLRVRVTVQAENLTVPLAFVSNLVPDASAVFQSSSSPTSGIPGATAGKATISTGTTLSEAALGRIGRGALGLQASTIYSYTLDISAGQAWPFSLAEQLDALRFRGVHSSRFEQLGNNLGYRVLIEPAFATAKLVAVTNISDLPCDFAVADQPNSGRFFPSACEPCEGSVIGLPPCGSVALVTPPANGGCVHPRYFNGMFITREDLETEQRYHRLKSKLHNRAAGAGVVWGLSVDKQGDHVCVMPGYGIDCCGNDLVLTTLYEVDIAALIADPAAASLVHQRQEHRMHLLLEYVECPSDARPVHGDPCAPEVSRCEMSRIRETVRLRLVPPRDYNAAAESAPVQRFLNEVRALQTRFPLSQEQIVFAPDRAPFQLRVTVNNPNAGSLGTVTVRPSPQSNSIQLPSGQAGSLIVEVRPDPLWTFVAGTLTGQALANGEAINEVVQPPDPIDLSLSKGFTQQELRITFALSNANQRPNELVFKMTAWQAQPLLASPNDPALSGDLTFIVPLAPENVIRGGRIEMSIVSKPLDLAPAPCRGEPCTQGERPDPAGCRPNRRDQGGNRGGTFNSTSNGASDPTPVLPCLHTDPLHPSGAGDPKALMLAALAGWLEQMMARERTGTTGEITSPRREIAQGIYRVAWLLLFGMPERADPIALGATLHRLLEGWCCGILWKGPECCGDPHGVVIGCAAVEGGTIQAIDPFGGRRYVVHYPLLEHWGAQFGIAPLDLTATRFFSKLCCVSALPPICVDTPTVSARFVRLGSGHLWVGDPQGFTEELRRAKIGTIVAQRKVSTPEMIVSALTLIGTRPSTNESSESNDSTYTALMLGDFVADQTVILLVPAPV